MTLYEQILAIYPNLTDADFFSSTEAIVLQNDSDGKGDYIKSWKNVNPQPTEAELLAVKK